MTRMAASMRSTICMAGSMPMLLIKLKVPLLARLEHWLSVLELPRLLSRLELAWARSRSQARPPL